MSCSPATVPRAAQPMPAKVLLVRHGQSMWNKLARVTGQEDPALANEGLQQARRLADVLRDEPLSAVYASTLTRALDTARPTAELHGLSVQGFDALREQHMGIAQGRFRDERDPEIQRIWQARCADRLNFRVPQGETFTELAARAWAALRQIQQRHAGEAVLIVGHRNTNRALLAALLGLPLEEAVDTRVASSRLYEIRPDSGNVRTISLRGEDVGRVTEGFRA